MLNNRNPYLCLWIRLKDEMDDRLCMLDQMTPVIATVMIIIHNSKTH